MDVTITRLEPMYYASAYGYGDAPELEALRHLSDWAGPKGLLHSAETVLYGFNNPFPTEIRPRYGYELWLGVPPGTEPEGNIRMGEFFGGTYAVTRCAGVQNLPSNWVELAVWLESSDRTPTGMPGFERYVSPLDTPFEDFVFELCLPLRD